MSDTPVTPWVVNGWSVFAHPLFLTQLQAWEQQALEQQVDARKPLAAIQKMAFDVIPQDPTRPKYRQDGTLGDEYKHWLRAECAPQYHLYFRYHLQAKLIVLVGGYSPDEPITLTSERQP